MKGHNELTLCEAELIVALQEYLQRRMGAFTPSVVGARLAQDQLTVVLTTPPAGVTLLQEASE